MAQERLFPLPDLSGRLAVLGGQPRDRTELCLSLALRQARQHGGVVCLDAHGRQQLEMPFRLLLRPCWITGAHEPSVISSSRSARARPPALSTGYSQGE